MAKVRKNEVLGKALASDQTVIPRFTIKDAAGAVIAENATVELMNPVITQGMAVDKQAMDECLAASGTLAGTAPTFTLAQEGYALFDGAPIFFKGHVDFFGPATLDVNGTGRKQLLSSKKTNMCRILAGGWYIAFYSLSLNGYILIDTAYQQQQLDMMLSATAYVYVTVKDASGTPQANIPITGLTTLTGDAVYTGSDGTAEGYCKSGSTTISIPQYIDYTGGTYTKTIKAEQGQYYTAELNIGTALTYKQILSSQKVIFSPRLSALDMTVVGGGGGGAAARTNIGGAGGGGGTCTVKTNVSFTPNTEYDAVVGSGGSNDSGEDTYNTSRGGAGGTSSLCGVTASGGKGASGASGGTGNGAGGSPGEPDWTSDDGYRRGSSGGAGTVQGYLTDTTTFKYGGGGGGGGVSMNDNYSAPSGGSGGSAGGARGGGGGGNGSSATANRGGGGGGGSNSRNAQFGNSGKGGSGIIVLRFRR